jgi:hypothetical protein
MAVSDPLGVHLDGHLLAQPLPHRHLPISTLANLLLVSDLLLINKEGQLYPVFLQVRFDSLLYTFFGSLLLLGGVLAALGGVVAGLGLRVGAGGLLLLTAPFLGDEIVADSLSLEFVDLP